MHIKFYDNGTLVWTGDLGFPIPRIGERVTLHFPADNNQPAESTGYEVFDVRYDIHPGIGNSAVIIDLERKSREVAVGGATPPLTRTQLTALFAMWGHSSHNQDMKNAPLMADIFMKLAPTV